MKNIWIEELRSKFFTATLEELDIPGAINLKHKHLPQKLFKYRPVNEFSLRNLRESSLYCSYASTFNDPYDSAVVFDPNFGKSYTSQLAAHLTSFTELDTTDLITIEQANDPIGALLRLYLAKFPETSTLSKEDIDRLAEVIQDGHERTCLGMLSGFNSLLQNSYKICSLSERIDSLLMWGHYGMEHKGFAMEYDFSSLPVENLMARCLWPVIYSEHIYDASELLVNAGIPGHSFNNMVAVIAALHKAKDWEYEKEWRIIIPDDQNTPPNSYRAPLKAIYLGSKIDEAHASKLYKEAELKNLPVFKMQLSQHEYKMEPIPYRHN